MLSLIPGVTCKGLMKLPANAMYERNLYFFHPSGSFYQGICFRFSLSIVAHAGAIVSSNTDATGSIPTLKCRRFRRIALECGWFAWQRPPIEQSPFRIGTGCGRAEARPYHNMSTPERSIPTPLPPFLPSSVSPPYTDASAQEESWTLWHTANAPSSLLEPEVPG